MNFDKGKIKYKCHHVHRSQELDLRNTKQNRTTKCYSYAGGACGSAVMASFPSAVRLSFSKVEDFKCPTWFTSLRKNLEYMHHIHKYQFSLMKIKLVEDREGFTDKGLLIRLLSHMSSLASLKDKCQLKQIKWQKNSLKRKLRKFQKKKFIKLCQ